MEFRCAEFHDFSPASSGLSYVGVEVFLYGPDALLHSRIGEVTLFVIGRILGCVFFAMAVPVAFPRSMKALLPISAAICVTFNIFALWFETHYKIRIALSSDGAGIFLGGLLACLLSRIESSKGRPLEQTHDSTAVT